MPQQFSPTNNEDRLIGGIQNFGSDKFSPQITNLTGQYKLRGAYQRVGRILHFAVLIEAHSGTFETTSSLFLPPVKPLERTVNSISNTVVFKGIAYQFGASTTMIPQNDDGSFLLVDETRSGESSWITGYYWVE